MRALILEAARRPLREIETPRPAPDSHQLLIRVEACAVCRTDLHVYDGELPDPKLPLILGHEIVGVVVANGRSASRFSPGDRVGVPWLGSTCTQCRYCASERENLCENAEFTGYTIDGGYAEYTVADERYCFRVPSEYSPAEAAPLFCAGLIGYRSLKKTGDARRLGIYGFGSAARIVSQIAIHQGREVYAFTRRGDADSQAAATKLGAVWAGDSEAPPPDSLDAAILFAPAGELVPRALRAVAPGGTVVCGGIHMSDIPSFPYSILWEERTLSSVANLTRRDGEEFLALAPKVPIRMAIEPFPLGRANEALDRLRRGQLDGTAVLTTE